MIKPKKYFKTVSQQQTIDVYAYRFTSIVQSQNQNAIFIFLFEELIETMDKSKHRDYSHKKYSGNGKKNSPKLYFIYLIETIQNHEVNTNPELFL